jgi:hypothetical protein
MSRMLRLLALVVVLALVGAGAALAGRGDPQEDLRPADQARARAMLLRAADVGPGFKASRTGTSENDFYCRALDESDLTITGEAESARFTGGLAFVTSTAYVYESVADSNASWRRGTSAAGQKCLADGLRRELLGTNVKLLSFRRLAFPRLGARSVAYRAVAAQQGARIYLDLVAIQHARAQAAVILGSGLAAPPRSVELRLGRLVAARMAKAMRSS